MEENVQIKVFRQRWDRQSSTEGKEWIVMCTRAPLQVLKIYQNSYDGFIQFMRTQLTVFTLIAAPKHDKLPSFFLAQQHVFQTEHKVHEEECMKRKGYIGLISSCMYPVAVMDMHKNLDSGIRRYTIRTWQENEKNKYALNRDNSQSQNLLKITLINTDFPQSFGQYMKYLKFKPKPKINEIDPFKYLYINNIQKTVHIYIKWQIKI